MKKLFVFALLFAAVAGAAHAQVWPTANPYTCDWTLNGTSGKSFVTFLYDPYNSADIDRTGTLRTVYPTGAINTKAFRLSWDWNSGSNYRFDYFWDLTNPTPSHCNITTANGGRDVTFSNCTGNAWQHCIQ
jgi:opacity protein-like surface antigen